MSHVLPCLGLAVAECKLQTAHRERLWPAYRTRTEHAFKASAFTHWFICVRVWVTHRMPSAVPYKYIMRHVDVDGRHSYCDSEQHFNVTSRACFMCRGGGGWQRLVHPVSCYRHGYLHRRRQVFCEWRPNWRDTVRRSKIAHSEGLAEIFCAQCQLLEASYQHERRDSLLKVELNHSLWRACSAVTTAIKTHCSNICIRETEIAGCMCVGVWLCVCVCVCVCAERGVLSVMSHTEKIKVLMAWASSNGTLSCAVHARACVRVYAYQQSCIQNVSYLFAAALRRWGPVFLSFYLQLPPSPCAHVGIYSHAPTVFQAAELHGSAPCVAIPSAPRLTQHISHTRTHCWESEEAISYFLHIMNMLWCPSPRSWNILCNCRHVCFVLLFHYNSDVDVVLFNPLLLLIWLQ